MRQCSDCEFFLRSESGEISFSCDPFSTVKEPECLAKWQIIKINQMVAGYQQTLNFYQQMAPMQEKVFKLMQRELNDLDESDKWKVEDGEPEEDDDEGEGDEKPKW